MFINQETSNNSLNLRKLAPIVMETSNLNAELINAVKEKLPKTENIATTLMDILFIGKEAVYRRLRGEVTFTLAEAALISKKLNISLDSIIGTSFKNSALFDLNIVKPADPFETYSSILDGHIARFRKAGNDPLSEMGTSSNIIPMALSLKYETLSKFRLFKWMYQIDNSRCKHFEEIIIPLKLLQKQQEFARLASHIHEIYYIWDSMIFSNLANDIRYFRQVHLLSDEDKELIKTDLLLLIDELEVMANHGRNKTGNEVKIYISNINMEATYSYLEAEQLQVSMMRIYSINSVITQDYEMFLNLKKWIQSLKKFSTLISDSGEMQRVSFIKQQRKIIESL